MWLVDFKLDFFNDIDKNGERTGTGVINLHIFMTWKFKIIFVKY
jgi:hypothetical protein